MLTQDLAINNPSDFEKVVALKFQRLGYEVIMPPANTKGYDIELRKDQECIAVQVKNHKVKCSISHVQKFRHFLELPLASKFTAGWFISASGYSKPTLTDVETEQPPSFRLGTFLIDSISWNYPKESSSPETEEIEDRDIKYIGIFTCKGGVGKTTVAAHLAGAFALMGHDVILLDLDPDRNLRKLFLQDSEDEQGDASLFVPPISKNGLGATITVLNADQWQQQDYPEVKIVICDCSPVLTENPKSLVEKFDYCVIPTTLNPLGVSKNGDVIIRTFKHIRELNAKAEMFALINNYISDKAAEKRNEVLLAHLKKSLSKYTATDPNCKFIDPDAAKIRSSNALLYWGYHIVEGTKPQLAFREVAGKSYPRTDFLQLAEYLEDHTSIDKLREKESNFSQNGKGQSLQQRPLMAISNYERVTKAIQSLCLGLYPFVTQELESQFGKSWLTSITPLLEGDHSLKRLPEEILKEDVAAQLRVINRQWEEVFRKTMGRAERSLVNELSDTRNKWAHGNNFSTDDTYRALDSISRLLNSISSPEAESVDSQKQELLELMYR